MRKPFFIPVCILLFLVVFGVFYPITGDDFINYDDNDYVTENFHVQQGLDWRQIKWAFSNTDAANWHPLTWLSHLLDCQLYGMNPRGHHLTGVLIHAANAVLVFVVLRAMTGCPGRSLFAALLFALHPLRVESVAWVAERKDVLSASFWLLSLWMYVRYAKKNRAKVSYVLSVLFFVLGLMCKPMLVTLPITLLLLDYWPLRRMTRPNAAHLAWEKAPFFLLAGVDGVVTLLAQKSHGAIIEYLPLSHRLETAALAYSRYLGKFFYPVNLAILYPHPPANWPLLNVAAALALFLCISVTVIAGRASRPYGMTGWWWYVATLAPVIGVIQVGSQSLADRYTYVPGLGLIIVLTWGVCDLAGRWPRKNLILGISAATMLITCTAMTRHQIHFWKDSGTVFSHAMAVTENGYIARKSLADFYVSQNRVAEAIPLYQEALEMHPGYEGAHLNLGAAFNLTGRAGDAISQFQQALRLQPDDASAYNDLGAVLGPGRLDESIALFRKAIEINPAYFDARKNLGQAMDMVGRTEEAITQYQDALRLRPDSDTHYLLGLDYEKTGRKADAILQWTEAVREQPGYTAARRALERLKRPGS